MKSYLQQATKLVGSWLLSGWRSLCFKGGMKNFLLLLSNDRLFRPLSIRNSYHMKAIEVVLVKWNESDSHSGPAACQESTQHKLLRRGRKKEGWKSVKCYYFYSANEKWLIKKRGVGMK